MSEPVKVFQLVVIASEDDPADRACGERVKLTAPGLAETPNVPVRTSRGRDRIGFAGRTLSTCAPAPLQTSSIPQRRILRNVVFTMMMWAFILACPFYLFLRAIR